MARDIARELRYIYIDTGAMYRAVTLYGLRTGLVDDNGVWEKRLIEHLPDLDISFRYDNTRNRSQTCLNGEDVEERIRGMEVSRHVSKVSALPAVRDKLVEWQKELGEQGGVVMDGRDIGTVVMPYAELKIFLTANPQVRAKRRYDELVRKGIDPDMEEVKHNIADRDHEDTHRTQSPLRKADDAVELDNSELSREEQLEKVLELVQEKVGEDPRKKAG